MIQLFLAALIATSPLQTYDLNTKSVDVYSCKTKKKTKLALKTSDYDYEFKIVVREVQPLVIRSSCLFKKRIRTLDELQRYLAEKIEKQRHNIFVFRKNNANVLETQY